MAVAHEPSSAADPAASAGREEPLHPWACALARLSGQLGRPLAAWQIQAAGLPPPEAVVARDLLSLAGRFGLRGETRSVTRRRLRSTPVPFLLTGRDQGEIRLVQARRGRKLELVDPVTGETALVPAGRVARHAREILHLRPESDGRQPEGLRGLLTRKRYWPAFAQLVFASIVINLLALATPLFMMTVYNRVIRHGGLSTLDALVVGMVSLVAFELVLRTLRGYVASFLGARLDAAVGEEVLRRLLRLPYGKFTGLPPARLFERLRQLDQLRAFLTGNLPLFLVDLAFVGLFLAGLFLLSPPLAWIASAALPLFALLSWIGQRAQSRELEAQRRRLGDKQTVLFETVANALTIKSLALEPEIERRFRRPLFETAWAGLRAARFGQLSASLAQALQHVVAVLLVYVGARMVVAGELSVGGLVAASILAARALAPARQLFFAWPQLQQVREAYRRVDALLREADDAASPMPSLTDLRIVGALRFEGISYGYRGDGPPALRGIDLEIPAGTLFGIAGAPGSGKTTLLRLAAGLARPREGRVLVDGRDLRHLPLDLYRRQIGVVPQELQLFSGTIAENIALGAENCSLSRVVAAARFVGLHPFIERLPRGYDTPLGEQGSGLSTGQKQLVCIARALVRNPRILLLDEATSALDAATEELFLANLRRAAGGRTILLVTHRRQVLQHCDRIAVLDGGRLLGTGTPSEMVPLLAGVPARSRPELRAARETG